MFRPGDKVKVHEWISSASKVHKGQVLEILSGSLTHEGSGKSYSIVNCNCPGSDRGGCGIWDNEITLLKELSNTEIGCLDAFQRNFEDGI